MSHEVNAPLMLVEHRVSSPTGIHMRTLNCDRIDFNF